jgi:5S rRNA maturation endonuclease (ribonuclease M5)
VTREEALARADLAKLLEDVGDGRGRRGVRGMFPCPELAHTQSGDSPPVAIRDRGGTDVWYCHSCEKGGSYVDALVACGRARDAADALSQLGVEKPSRDRPAAAPTGNARAVAWYEYVDADGAPLYRVVRYEPKTFRQQRWEDGEWKPGRGDAPAVPYRLPRVLEAIRHDEFVFVVEGEKDVEALERQGRVATTNAGGSGKWEPSFADLLGPRARVVIVADDDDAGYKHARDVEAKLYGKVGLLLLRRPADGFKDVSEMVEADVPVGSGSLRKLPETGHGSISGPLMLTARAMAARPASSDALQVVGPLFQRGMRTTIGAQTGEGKTTLAMQAVKALVSGEPFLDDAWKPRRLGKALIVDLEQGEETVKARLREAGLDESDAVDVLWEPSGLSLDSDPAHRALIRDALRKGGYDLVILDPLYQLHRGDANNERVAADVIRYVDEWARDFNCSIVVPMHARKPHPDAGKNMTIHDIAGSSTWNRNAEFVVGLQLLSAGMSRVWFFKDRIGKGPEIRKWWGLSFRRADGFGRNFVEDQQARNAQAKDALARDDGVTREEIMRILGVAEGDEIGGKRLAAALRKAHEQDGRFRSRPWQIAGQTSMLDGGADV